MVVAGHVRDCVFSGRKRTAGLAVTTIRWIGTVCDRRALCPSVMLNRVSSQTELRTRGVGPSAHEQARPSGRSTWSFAVGKPVLSA
jgi:hypothetical protein